MTNRKPKEKLRHFSLRKNDYSFCNSNSVFVFTKKSDPQKLSPSKINYDLIFSNEQSLINDNILTNMSKNIRSKYRIYPKSSRGYRDFRNRINEDNNKIQQNT